MSSYQDNIDLEMELVAIQMATDKILAISDGIQKLSVLKWEDKSEGEKKFLSFLSDRVFTTETDLVDGNEAVYINLNKAADMAKAAWPAIKKAAMAVYKFIKDAITRVWKWFTGLFSSKQDGRKLGESVMDISRKLSKIELKLNEIKSQVERQHKEVVYSLDIGVAGDQREAVLKALEKINEQLERELRWISARSKDLKIPIERYRAALQRLSTRDFSLSEKEISDLEATRRTIAQFLNSGHIFDRDASFTESYSSISDSILDTLRDGNKFLSERFVNTLTYEIDELKRNTNALVVSISNVRAQLDPATRIERVNNLLSKNYNWEVRNIDPVTLNNDSKTIKYLHTHFVHLKDRIPDSKLLALVSKYKNGLVSGTVDPKDFRQDPLYTKASEYTTAQKTVGPGWVTISPIGATQGLGYSIDIRGKFMICDAIAKGLTMPVGKSEKLYETYMTETEKELRNLLGEIQLFLDAGGRGLLEGNEAFKAYVDDLEKYGLSDFIHLSRWQKFIPSSPISGTDDAMDVLPRLSAQLSYAKMMRSFTSEFSRVANIARELKVILDTGWPV